MKKYLISFIIGILCYLSFTHITLLVHFRYWFLRKMGLRKPAQMQYQIDKLDPGERISVPFVIRIQKEQKKIIDEFQERTE